MNVALLIRGNGLYKNTLLVFLFIFFICTNFLFAQLSTMNANDYRAVSAISGNVVTITPNIGNFVVGDQVLLIQMKGATIDVTNTSSYGTISSLNNAGNYEIRTITSISGLNITLNSIARTYTITGLVQLVRFKRSSTSTSTPSSITAVAWNGSVGGVVAIQVTGTLTIASGHTITANGAGFRGGAVSGISDGTAWCNFSDFRSTNITAACYQGIYAQKGEGIADDSPNDYARGAQASGGGGAGEHNSGGGGGGNLSAGGSGGRSITNCGIRRNATGMNCSTPAAGTVQSNICGDETLSNGVMTAGLGGKALSAGSVNNRFFLGGGGGGGQRNGTAGSSGGAGGGIIIIDATSITNNSGVTAPITANGVQPALVTSNEGAGGGGAGGSIIINTSSFTNAITVQARGAAGGNTQTVNNECRGPGGGGGGGLIWVTGLSSTTNLTTNIQSGAPGQNICGSGCTSTASLSCVISGATVSNCASTPTNGLVEITTLLPVTYIYFRGKLERDNLVYLNWVTVNEIDNTGFIIEKSLNGIDFKPIGRVEEQGNTTQETYYHFIDRQAEKINYYRLKQIDIDGKINYSKIIVVSKETIDGEKVEVFPNPATTFVNIKCNSETKVNQVKLLDNTGREIMTSIKQTESNIYKVNFLQDMAQGAYILQIYTDTQVLSEKVYIAE